MWRISKGRIDRLVVFVAPDGVPVPVGELVMEGGSFRGISHFRSVRIELAFPHYARLNPAAESAV